MNHRHPRPSRSRSPRPPRIPVPLLHPGERVRGSAMLEEGVAGEWGLVLWESYRNVGDWAATPRERRAPGMFGDGAAERRTEQLRPLAGREPVLAGALETIRGLLADPAAADARAVADACRRVAAWAGEGGRPLTRFYFAAAAGLCEPEDARQAYEAGRLARDLARWDAAEVWLEYAAAAARRKRDRETQAIAVLGLGNLFYRRGFYRKAREVHLAALALARRHALREHCGRALHDLFVIAVELRDGQAAEAYAREALAAYGASHPNVLSLGFDVAYHWLAQGDVGRALPVLRALHPHTAPRSALRLRVLACGAHAAAAVGDRALFTEMADQAREAGSIPDARGALAAALVEIAKGAALLEEETLATGLLDDAMEVARARGEVDVLARVDELRHRLDTGTIVGVAVPAAPPGPDDLMADLLRSLETGGAGTPGGTAPLVRS
ncbi:MAG TPA: hypothetical protein VHG51_04815 [Longimicrobiaceae bacterium]|nr:hypothetical protein [Longimicrobiaceae bacterium]